MNPEQIAILNTLLRKPTWMFTADQQRFLITLATKLRYTNLTRCESIALERIAFAVIEGPLPEHDPGIVNTWGEYNVAPGRDSGCVGGPGGTRPPGTGDGNDVPDGDAPQFTRPNPKAPIRIVP